MARRAILMCLWSLPALAAYDQPAAGPNAGGGVLASGNYGGFGYLTTQATGALTGGGFRLALGFLAQEPLPAGVPGAPVIVRVVGGDTSLKILFSAPASDGGANIDSYIVTCTAAGGAPVHQSGARSPIVVAGLSHGDAYTCTVRASNSAGSGVESAAVRHFVRRPATEAVFGILLDN